MPLCLFRRLLRRILLMRLKLHVDVIETTSQMTTALRASRSWFETVDVSRCDTRDHQRSSTAPTPSSPAVRWGAQTNFNALRRSFDQRYLAARPPPSHHPQSLQPASPERSLWSKCAWPYLASKMLDHRFQASKSLKSAPRRPARERKPTKSQRLRAMIIERHRCRIYEMSYAFDRSSCWGGKNASMASTSSIIKLLPAYISRASLIIQ